MTILDKQLTWFIALTNDELSLQQFIDLQVNEGDIGIPEDSPGGLPLLETCLRNSELLIDDFYSSEDKKYTEPLKELEEKLNSLGGEELEAALTRAEHLNLRSMELKLIYGEYKTYLDRFKAIIEEYKKIIEEEEKDAE